MWWRLFSVFCALSGPVFADGTTDPGAYPLDRTLPVIRHIDTLETGEETLLHQPLAGDLIITYSAEPGRPMTQAMAGAADLTLPMLHRQAMENLLQKAERAVISGSAEGLYLLTLDGENEAALLLDQALWQSITDLAGPVVVSVPAPHLVLFAPKNDPAARRLLEDVRKTTRDSDNSLLSDQLFTWQSGTWNVVAENTPL